MTVAMQQDAPKKPQQLSLAIERIREAFLLGLDQRIEALDVLLCQLDETDNPILALHGIAEIAHGVSGVAKTLGFPELGTTASGIDTQIAIVLSGPICPQALSDIVRDVDAMVDHMDGL